MILLCHKIMWDFQFMIQHNNIFENLLQQINKFKLSNYTGILKENH